MIVAFAPIIVLLLGLSSITVPRNALLLSVGLYIVVPVGAALLRRRALLAKSAMAALRMLSSLSLSALLAIGDANPDSGLFQLRVGLLAQSTALEWLPSGLRL